MLQGSPLASKADNSPHCLLAHSTSRRAMKGVRVAHIIDRSFSSAATVKGDTMMAGATRTMATTFLRFSANDLATPAPPSECPINTTGSSCGCGLSARSDRAHRARPMSPLVLRVYACRFRVRSVSPKPGMSCETTCRTTSCHVLAANLVARHFLERWITETMMCVVHGYSRGGSSA